MSTPRELGPEALLAQQDFVRALVRSLLRTGDGEDDIVQRTWLQVLLRRPRDGERGRQWLGQVARNLTRDHLRATRRRSAREQRAARPDLVPSTAEIVQREAERKRVVEALLGLAEPYRGALLLRYFDDLSPATIAARLGVPGATVRARLQRGLGMLRAKLDDEYGDRRSWLAALTPCAMRPEAAAAATLGAVSMSVPSKITWTVCGIVLAGLALWSLTGGATEPAAAPPVATDPAHLAAASEPRPDATDLGDQDARDAAPRRRVAPEPGFTLRGEVRHDGQPFAGLALTASWHEGLDGESSRGEPRRRVQVRSDEDGTFTWQGPMPESTTTIRLRSEDPRRYVFADPVIVFPGDGEARCLVSVTLLDCALSGTVRSGDGKAIAGAFVSSNGWTDTRTDGEGRYRLDVGSGAASRPLLVQAAGYVQQLVQTNIPEGAATQTLDVILQPGTSIAGQVLDPTGAPAAGVEVRASGAFRSVRSDADGRFVFDSIQPETNHRIEARTRGYALAATDAKAGDHDVELRLRTGVALTGHVRRRDGQPVAGAAVRVRVGRFDQAGTLAHCDHDGSFRIEDLPCATKVQVSASKAGFASAHTEVELDAVDGEVEFRLDPGGSVRGRVVDEAGRPVAGASVYAERAGDDSMSRAVGRRCDSDADGRFEVVDLPPDPCHVYAFSRGFIRGSQPAVLPGGPELVIRLERALTVAGRVVDAATRRPITEFEVRIAKAEELGAPWIRSVRFADPGGAWQASESRFVAGEPLHVEVSAAGYAPARTTMIASRTPAADTGVIALTPGLTLRGRVRHADGEQPVAGARLALLRDGENTLVAQSPSTPSAVTGTDGTFELAHLAPGAVRLVVSHADHASIVHGPIQLDSESAANAIEIVIGGGVAVRGRVTGFARTDELSLTLASLSVDTRLQAAIAADGTFAVDKVAPGPYMLVLNQPGADARMLRLVVRTEDVDGLEVRAKDGDARVRIVVQGADAGEVRLRPLDDAPRGQRFVTRIAEFARGVHTVDGLAAIRYQVRVEVGTKTQTRTADLRAQSEVDLTFDVR
ncbi:MAG: sigma-70 family RNA polymerase sigma factor [Planctomycetota bacterium]